MPKIQSTHRQEQLMFNQFINTTLELTKVENPNLFPFPFKLHIAFSLAAFIFFIIRYYLEKKPYQLIIGISIPFSMTLWLSESRVWFYTVGAIEAILLASAFISNLIYNKNHPEADENNKAE